MMIDNVFSDFEDIKVYQQKLSARSQYLAIEEKLNRQKSADLLKNTSSLARKSAVDSSLVTVEKKWTNRKFRKLRSRVGLDATICLFKKLIWEFPSEQRLQFGKVTVTPTILSDFCHNRPLNSSHLRLIADILNGSFFVYFAIAGHLEAEIDLGRARYICYLYPNQQEPKSRWSFLFFNTETKFTFSFCRRGEQKQGALRDLQKVLERVNPRLSMVETRVLAAHGDGEEGRLLEHDCAFLCGAMLPPWHWHKEAVLGVYMCLLSACPKGHDHIDCIIRSSDCSNNCFKRLDWLEKKSLPYHTDWIRWCLIHGLITEKLNSNWFLSPKTNLSQRQRAPPRQPPTSPASHDPIVPTQNRFELLNSDTSD